jgi:hypothetical protein
MTELHSRSTSGIAIEATSHVGQGSTTSTWTSNISGLPFTPFPGPSAEDRTANVASVGRACDYAKHVAPRADAASRHWLLEIGSYLTNGLPHPRGLRRPKGQHKATRRDLSAKATGPPHPPNACDRSRQRTFLAGPALALCYELAGLNLRVGWLVHHPSRRAPEAQETHGDLQSISRHQCAGGSRLADSDVVRSLS